MAVEWRAWAGGWRGRLCWRPGTNDWALLLLVWWRGQRPLATGFLERAKNTEFTCVAVLLMLYLRGVRGTVIWGRKDKTT